MFQSKISKILGGSTLCILCLIAGSRCSPSVSNDDEAAIVGAVDPGRSLNENNRRGRQSSTSTESESGDNVAEVESSTSEAGAGAPSAAVSSPETSTSARPGTVKRVEPPSASTPSITLRFRDLGNAVLDRLRPGAVNENEQPTPPPAKVPKTQTAQPVASPTPQQSPKQPAAAPAGTTQAVSNAQAPVATDNRSSPAANPAAEVAAATTTITPRVNRVPYKPYVPLQPIQRDNGNSSGNSQNFIDPNNLSELLQDSLGGTVSNLRFPSGGIQFQLVILASKRTDLLSPTIETLLENATGIRYAVRCQTIRTGNGNRTMSCIGTQ